MVEAAKPLPPAEPEMSRRYTAVAAILVLIGVGWWMVSLKQEMENPLKIGLYNFHKSLGITVLLLTLARIGWRLGHKPPPLPDHMTAIERVAARSSHFGFYVLLLAVPLSGWVFTSSVGFAPPFWGLGELPNLYRWDEATKTAILFGFIPLRGLFADSVQAWTGMQTVHRWLGYALMALLVAHVSAALKHTFIDKDGLMLRMAPRFGRRG